MIAPEHARLWAAREVARGLRAYANAELRVPEDGMRPSGIAQSIALICRNLATTFENGLGQLGVKLAAAEQRVIAAAREGRPREIRSALAALDAVQAEIDEERRRQTIKKLTDPA